MKTPTLAAAMLIAATLPALTAAEDGGWTGFYAGAQGGAIDTDLSFAGVSVGEDSTTYGLFAGYNHAIGNNLVLGGELNIDKLDYSDLNFRHDRTTKRVKARLGYDLGRAMIFGTLGYAEVSDGTGDDEDGHSLGLGVDYKVTDSVILGAELLRDSYDFEGVDMDVTSLRLRISYQF